MRRKLVSVVLGTAFVVGSTACAENGGVTLDHRAAV